jgi:hypothetical protein
MFIVKYFKTMQALHLSYGSEDPKNFTKFPSKADLKWALENTLAAKGRVSHILMLILQLFMTNKALNFDSETLLLTL